MADLEHFDIVVIGGGSGLTAAYYAERDGRSIALITDRPDAMGGTCINFGCIPTKTLIETARRMDAIRAAADFGITLDVGSMTVDFAAVMDQMRAARADNAAGARGWVENAMTLIDSRVRFVGNKLLETNDGRRITGERIFIASGSSPSVPPIDGLDDVDYWTNADVLELSEQPQSLVIIGGGYIGCELGYFFAALGTDVTLVHPSAMLLAEDADIGALFTEQFEKRVRRVTGRAVGVREMDGRKIVTVESDDGARDDVEAEALLLAVGRTPNTSSLALAQTGVRTDDNGAVVVDDHLRTSHAEIYAYGDVIGVAPFKHTSSTEGEVAYANAFGGDRVMDYRANPHAVFSNPEIAGVGLTEQECQEQALDYRVATIDYGDTAKGRIIGAPPGMAKLMVDNSNEAILGCHIVGPNAALLIHEVVVAMNSDRPTADIVRRAIHIHPSLSELIGTLFDNA